MSRQRALRETLFLRFIETLKTLKVVRGKVDGCTFLDFVYRDLLPLLMSFDDVNHNNVAIMDNFPYTMLLV